VELTIGLALIAGFVSFVSPCVLPLVPAYIGCMGGRVSSANGPANAAAVISLGQRLNTVIHGAFFVLGFTLIFVTLGLLSTAFVQQIGGANVRLLTDLIGRLGGLVISGFGLHFMGVLPRWFARLRAHPTLPDSPLLIGGAALLLTLALAWGFNGAVLVWQSAVWAVFPGVTVISLLLIAALWIALLRADAFRSPRRVITAMLDRSESALYADTRRQFSRVGRGSYLDSVVMGVVFSAGWTPCVGPVYGAVLTMAANGGDVGAAAGLLLAYSLGLGIPFLLTALTLDGARVWLKRAQRQLRTVEVFSGALLIAIGIAVATGQLQRLSEQFAGDFAEFSVRVEEDAIALLTGQPFAGVAVPASAATTDASSETGLEIGQLAPDFATVTLDGTPVRLADYRGQAVLLNFWATWCGPCRIEMPIFERSYRQHAAAGFVVLAVNNRETPETIATFRDALRLSFPIALDPDGAIQRQYGILNYPSTLLLDQSGRIVYRHFGIVPPADLAAMLTRVGLTE